MVDYFIVHQRLQRQKKKLLTVVEKLHYCQQAKTVGNLLVSLLMLDFLFILTRHLLNLHSCGSLTEIRNL